MCPQGCIPSRGSKGESVSLSFPGSFWAPSSIYRASCVCLCAFALWSHCPFFDPHSTAPLSRNPGDNTGPTWITQIELKILNHTCEVPLPCETTYPQVPGTRKWTSLGPVLQCTSHCEKASQSTNTTTYRCLPGARHAVM